MPPRTGPLPISTGVEPQNVIVALLVAFISVAVQVWLSVRFLPLLPAMVSSHWNFKGEVDGHMSKRVMVWIGPILAAVFGAISVGLAFTPSSLFLQVPFWLVQALFIYVTWWMYQRNLHRS
ncbi:DUF1648 domain-containing protein [Alicyclobacillus curvatus]|nr:DUF1648 domain-containing protein [Alicyclobacillus curvatus]